MKTSTLLMISCVFIFLVLNQVKDVEAQEKSICNGSMDINGKCAITKEEQNKQCLALYNKPGPKPTSCTCVSNYGPKHFCSCFYPCPTP